MEGKVLYNPVAGSACHGKTRPGVRLGVILHSGPEGVGEVGRAAVLLEGDIEGVRARVVFNGLEIAWRLGRLLRQRAGREACQNCEGQYL